MYFKFNIERTQEVLIDSSPQALEIWIGESDGVNVKILTKTTQIIEDGSGTITKEVNRVMPASELQPMISGYDLITNSPVLNLVMFDAYIQAGYSLKLKEP